MTTRYSVTNKFYCGQCNRISHLILPTLIIAFDQPRSINKFITFGEQSERSSERDCERLRIRMRMGKGNKDKDKEKDKEKDKDRSQMKRNETAKERNSIGTAEMVRPSSASR